MKLRSGRRCGSDTSWLSTAIPPCSTAGKSPTVQVDVQHAASIAVVTRLPYTLHGVHDVSVVAEQVDASDGLIDQTICAHARDLTGHAPLHADNRATGCLNVGVGGFKPLPR